MFQPSRSLYVLLTLIILLVFYFTSPFSVQKEPIKTMSNADARLSRWIEVMSPPVKAHWAEHHYDRPGEIRNLRDQSNPYVAIAAYPLGKPDADSPEYQDARRRLKEAASSLQVKAPIIPPKPTKPELVEPAAETIVKTTPLKFKDPPSLQPPGQEEVPLTPGKPPGTGSFPASDDTDGSAQPLFVDQDGPMVEARIDDYSAPMTRLKVAVDLPEPTGEPEIFEEISEEEAADGVWEIVEGSDVATEDGDALAQDEPTIRSPATFKNGEADAILKDRDTVAKPPTLAQAAAGVAAAAKVIANIPKATVPPTPPTVAREPPARKLVKAATPDVDDGASGDSNHDAGSLQRPIAAPAPAAAKAPLRILDPASTDPLVDEVDAGEAPPAMIEPAIRRGRAPAQAPVAPAQAAGAGAANVRPPPRQVPVGGAQVPPRAPADGNPAAARQAPVANKPPNAAAQAAAIARGRATAETPFEDHPAALDLGDPAFAPNPSTPEIDPASRNPDAVRNPLAEKIPLKGKMGLQAASPAQVKGGPLIRESLDETTSAAGPWATLDADPARFAENQQKQKMKAVLGSKNMPAEEDV